jgi:serine/threonine protein phosphatase PrpC
MYGASSMQGWRRSNEDAHVTALDFEPGHSLFAVFDGHGGCEVAKFCEKYIVSELKADKDFQNRNYENALRNVFLKIDKKLLTD